MNEPRFTISLFEGVGDSRPRMVQRTWAQLCAKFAKPIIRQEKDGLLFSPANYRRPRRLIANVIELSLLVLEVDGAWKCDSCGYKAPLIMFRNAKHAGDRCQPCWKAKVPLPHSVSQIQFDMAMLVEDVRKAFQSAFAIYSTHSHKHVTDKNPLAEPRFRIVVPLSTPVPIGKFPELWETAVEALTVVPADPQVKDPNRIYYTPVKFCDEAPYEYHIEPGEFLNWHKLVQPIEPTAVTPNDSSASRGSADIVPDVLPSAVSSCEASPVSYARQSAQVTGTGQSGTRSHSGAADSSASDYFSSYIARHEELCRRIVAQAKQNSRGNYDMRCPAHDGKGTTSLCYFPRTGAVMCNRQCDYLTEILPAFGLPSHIIRSIPPDIAAAGSPLHPADAANPRLGSNTTSTPPMMTAARLHVINALLLAHCFELTPEDEVKVRKHWGDPFSEDIEWPGTDDTRPIKICSLPSPRLQLEAAKRISEHFDLCGVPGVYRATELPGPEAQDRRNEIEQFGPWRFNFPWRMKPGALIGPYDNNSGYILGIRIFRSVKDQVPFLLSSRGLPSGASAVSCQPTVAG